MFPLGSVLFPHMPLSLHVFEPRYRTLVEHLLTRADAGEPAELGVVLIERGHEVGGGEQRFATGTVARLTQVGRVPDGRYAVTAVGTRRVAVRAWLPDDPYPRAEVDDIADGGLDPATGPALLAAAEAQVRRCLTLKAELDEPTWPADVELDLDPTVAAWQLAGIAPLGPLDQLGLLAAADLPDVLTLLARAAEEEAGVLAFRLGSG
jgi:Lon protease-like protein